MNRGIARRMAARLDEALSDLDRALELHPTSPDALLARALAWFDKGHLPEALRDCDRAIALRPAFDQALRFKQYLQGAAL
jgi:tetratricopeptide (TPR) repeat protein